MFAWPAYLFRWDRLAASAKHCQLNGSGSPQLVLKRVKRRGERGKRRSGTNLVRCGRRIYYDRSKKGDELALPVASRRNLPKSIVERAGPDAVTSDD